MSALVRLIIGMLSIMAGVGSVLASIRGEFGLGFNLAVVGIIGGIIVFVERP